MEQEAKALIIQRLRESAGLTHGELAEAAGVSRQTISKAEKGLKVRDGTLLKMVEAIGPGDGNSIQSQYYNRSLMFLGVIDVEAPPTWDAPKIQETAARDLVYKSIKYLSELSKRTTTELGKADRFLLLELKSLSAVTEARLNDILQEKNTA